MGETLASSNHVIARAVEDIALSFEEAPFATTDTPLLQLMPLRGKDYDLIVLTNIRDDSALPGPVSVRTRSPYRKAVLHTTEGEWTLPVKEPPGGDAIIDIPEAAWIEYGGVIVIK